MKKKVLSIVILLGVFFAVQGQDTARYLSFFGEDSTRWNGITNDYDICPINHVLRASYDTIIDSLTYKKIEYSQVILGRDHVHYGERREPDHDIFLREERDKGRLWCRIQGESEDFIIADLSLSIGDKILLRLYMDYYDGELERFTVQDTSVVDGEKVITLECGGVEAFHFVEGMGCTNLLDYVRVRNNGIGSMILCCHKDGERTYHIPSYYAEPADDCYIWPWGIEDISNSQEVTVYPNPCKDWTMLHGEGITSVSILNTNGALIKRISIHNEDERLDLSDIPSGLYHILVTQRDNSRRLLSLIKY